MVIGVQMTDTYGSLMRSAEAIPLAMTRSVDNLPAVQPLDEMLVLPKAELVSAIMHRPLFEKSRKLQMAQQTETTSQYQIESSEEPPAIELIGTLLSQRSDVALVQDEGSRSRRLQIGDRVSDWQIVRIQRDNLLLEQDGSLAPVKLRSTSKAGSPR